MKKIYTNILNLWFISIISISTSSANVPGNIIHDSVPNFVDSLASQYLNDVEQVESPITAVSISAQCSGHNLTTLSRGMMSKSSSMSINNQSLFQIGSITKSFIAVVMLQLASQYQFSLDDKIGKWLHEYPVWENITLRQLLNMNSGIADYLEDSSFYTEFNLINYIPPSDILEYQKNKPLGFTSGSNFHYSNTNYVLLGQIVKTITGNDASEEINTRIIKKLQLKNTFFVVDKPSQVANSSLLITGYNYDHGLQKLIGDNILATYSLSWTNSAGAMISTTADLTHYIHTLFSTDKLLSHAQFKQLTDLVSQKSGKSRQLIASDSLGFGLGIMAKYINEQHKLIYFFSGGTFGFTFSYFYDPISQTSIAIAVNKHGESLYNYDLWPELQELITLCR